MSSREPRSPYRRHEKTPHVYSATYQHWRKAIKDNNTAEALTQTCAHAKAMQVRNEACNSK